MRLIDADALLNRMRKDPLFDLVEIHGVSGVIEAEPTVDAEPVIRCKDCKYWWQENNLCTHNKTMDGMVCSLQCDAYFYCGYAERKEDGKETD